MKFSSPVGSSWCPEEASALQLIHFIHQLFSKEAGGAKLELHIFHSVLKRYNSEIVLDALLTVLEPMWVVESAVLNTSLEPESSAWLREVLCSSIGHVDLHSELLKHTPSV